LHPFLASQLDEMLRRRGTDLYLSAGNRPSIRVDGDVVPTSPARVAGEVMEAVLRTLLGDAGYQAFLRQREKDLSFEHGGVRIRANAFFHQGRPALALRLIPREIPTMQELGLPRGARLLAGLPRGLVLVTGPTGSGKSTTLAAMIRHINETKRLHIVTIEDPIEYVHEPVQCVVEQREVGTDTLSFASGLRSALRQNPDVVLVGEMRDPETIATAVTLAETGHLVFATLHTQDAPGAVDRIVDVFPAAQQQQVRVQLAASLMGVVAQLLLPRVGGGRVACFEVMLATPAVRGQIREGKTQGLRTTIITSVGEGMQTMEMSMVERYREGLVRLEDIRERTVHRDELDSLLRQGGLGEAARGPLARR
jgi:twitching motility protein PilT